MCVYIYIQCVCVYIYIQISASMMHPNRNKSAEEEFILEFKYHATRSTPVLLSDRISTRIRVVGDIQHGYVSDLMTASVLVCAKEISFPHPLHLLSKISRFLLWKTYWKGYQPGCINIKTDTLDSCITVSQIWKLCFAETNQWQFPIKGTATGIEYKNCRYHTANCDQIVGTKAILRQAAKIIVKSGINYIRINILIKDKYSLTVQNLCKEKH